MLTKFLNWLASVNPPASWENFLRRCGTYNDNPDNWAQASHIGLGYSAVFTFNLLSVLLVSEPVDAIRYILLFDVLFLLFFFFKEFWFDIRYEKGEDIASSWEDWRSWLIGVVVADIAFIVVLLIPMLEKL